MDMKKVISVTRDQRDFLCKAFGVTKVMVSYALNYHPTQGQSELAKKIRNLALQRGGYMLVTAPASEVVYDADGVFKQYFENGWMWEADKHTGLLLVKNEKGEIVERMENAYIKTIEAVQQAIESSC